MFLIALPDDSHLYLTNFPCSLIPQFFLEVGNKKANSFWAANLPLEEELHSAATEEQRATFIRRKYRERKYRKVLEGFNDVAQLNQVQL